MGKISNKILDMMGVNTAPSPYSKADWMGEAPKPQKRDYTEMSGLTDKQIRELEKKKKLPRNIQLMILNRDTK